MKGKLHKVQTYLDYLYSLDYKERPVSVERFLSDPQFFGLLTERGRAVYPIWMSKLKEIMSENSKYLIVLTGGIGCLGANTKVSLLDGRELTIPEIIRERKAGKQHWVYSYDVGKGEFVPGKVVDAMLSGAKVNRIMRIKLDNKETILCTHNHPFMMRDGSYREAQYLCLGDSLMPLYRGKGKEGYEFIGVGKSKWKPTFRLVAEKIYGLIPKNHCVHHIDFQKRNNNPENLKIMTSYGHRMYHATVGNPFSANKEYASQCARKANKKRWTGSCGVKQRKIASKRLKLQNRKGLAKKASRIRWTSGDVKKKKKEVGDLIRKLNLEGLAKRAIRIRWSKPGAREHQRQKMVEWYELGRQGKHRKNCHCFVCDPKKGKSHPWYGRHHTRKSKEKGRVTIRLQFANGRIVWNKGLTKETDERVAKNAESRCGFHHIREAKRLTKNFKKVANHKIVSIEYFKKRIDVYDLSIKKYHNFALSAGVFVHNTGKSRVAAVYGTGYLMYRIMLLKDPWKFFNLALGGKMAITFFNLTKSLSDSKGYSTLQSHLTISPWFKSKGFVRGKEPNFELEIPLFSYKLCSPYAKGFGYVGEDIIIGIMDEVDSRSESPKQKKRILDAYDEGISRFESRFVVNGETLGKYWLVASKQDETSFLEPFVEERSGSREIYVADVPLWEAKPAANYSGKKFKIAVGDIIVSSKILDSETEELEAVKAGRRIIEVPVEHRKTFERNINLALKDIAGVSVIGIRRSKLFSSEKLIIDCFDSSKKDPFKNLSTLMLGSKDNIEIINFFDINTLRVPLNIPRFIHLDIAFTKDALGLAMSCVKGWVRVDVETEEGGGAFVPQDVPIIETDFALRIKAPEGDSIPIYKVRRFIIKLKALGVNVSLFTADLRLASFDTFQILNQRNIKTDYLSVDKDPKPYMDFRNIVTERRWVFHSHPFVFFEMKNLNCDEITGKVDHPDKVKQIVLKSEGGIVEYILKGSKDLCDAIAGSVANALKYTKRPIDGAAIKKIIQASKERSLDAVSPLNYIDNWWKQMLTSPVETAIDTSKILVEEKISVKKLDTAQKFVELMRKARSK